MTVNIYIQGSPDPITINCEADKVHFISIGTYDRPASLNAIVSFRDGLCKVLASNATEKLMFTSEPVTVSTLDLSK
jgi:hypothetical protein